MNVFGALAQPIVDRPGSPPAMPRRSQPNKARKLRDLPVIENPWDLTPCHCRVLILTAEGRTTHEIADQLCVSVKTIESHVLHAIERIEVVTGERVNRTRAAVLVDRLLRDKGLVQ